MNQSDRVLVDQFNLQLDKELENCGSIIPVHLQLRDRFVDLANGFDVLENNYNVANKWNKHLTKENNELKHEIISVSQKLKMLLKKFELPF